MKPTSGLFVNLASVLTVSGMSVHSGIVSDISPLCVNLYVGLFYMEVSEIDELDTDWLMSSVTSMRSLLHAKPAAGSLMMSVLPSLVTDI